MAKFKLYKGKLEGKGQKIWILERTNPRTKKKYVSWFIKLEYSPRGIAKTPYVVGYGGKNKKRGIKYFPTKAKALKYISTWKKSK